VEIITAKTQKPNPDWLHFVVTSKAKSKIKQKLNEEKVKEAAHGKEIIKRRFKNWKIEYSDETIRQLLKHYKLKNAQDFYYAVSQEDIELQDIKKILGQISSEKDVTEVPLQVAETKSSQELIKQQIDDYLIIDEKVGNVDYKLAKCCNPIPGDRIFGFVTVQEGIKIHRVSCPNAARLIGKYGYRIVKARWTRKDPDTVFPVDIAISGEDNPGILNSISEALAKDLKISIRSINLDTNDGVFDGVLSITVRDLKHLDELLERLKKLKGVFFVGRVEV
jgi:GTP pyrophosphokinase